VVWNCTGTFSLYLAVLLGIPWLCGLSPTGDAFRKNSPHASASKTSGERLVASPSGVTGAAGEAAAPPAACSLCGSSASSTSASSATLARTASSGVASSGVPSEASRTKLTWHPAAGNGGGGRWMRALVQLGAHRDAAGCETLLSIVKWLQG
jgi:hypothetical protein